MANILIATHWTGGDVLPFIRVGKVLKKRGHSVTVFTHCVYKEKVTEEGMNFVPWDTQEEYNQMINDLPLLSDPLNNLQGTIEFHKRHHSKKRCILEYEKIKMHCNIKDTVLIARHRSSISALFAAEKLKIPVATVFLAPNYISHMQLHEELFGNIMAENINSVRSEIGLKPIKSWTEWLRSPKRKLAIWPEWFASPDETWPRGIVPVGFHLEDSTIGQEMPDEVSGFLNDYKKPVLITGGTSKMVKPEFYEAAATACKLLALPAILVTQHDELVPEHLPDSIKRFKQLPLRSIMPHMKAIIHHGGMGTLSEAIAAGIPQLILPHLTDGPDNAHRLKKLGIAEFLPPLRWQPNLLKEKLVNVLSWDFSEKCRVFSQQIHEDENRICNAIEELIENEEFLMPEADDVPYFNAKSKEYSMESKDLHEPGKLDMADLSEEKRQLLARVLRKKLKESKNDG